MKPCVRNFTICLVLLSLVILGCWQFKLLGEPEPVYRGKPLRDWVREVEVNRLFHEPPPDAVEALRAIGPAAFPHLITWLGPLKSDWGLSHRLNHILPIRLSSPESRPTRSAVVAAFNCLGPKAKLAIPGISNVLSRSSVYLTSSSAISALGCLGPEAVPALIAGLTNNQPGMRPELLRHLRKEILEQFALMGSNSASAVPVILSYAHGSDNYLRGEALLALGFIGEAREEYVDLLTRALDDPDADVRGGATRGLAGFGEAAKAAAPRLVELLADTDFVVRIGALSSLAAMGPQSGIPTQSVEPLLGDSNRDIRHYAVHLLGNIGDPAAINALIKMTNDVDARVRNAAVDSLGRISTNRPGNSYRSPK